MSVMSNLGTNHEGALAEARALLLQVDGTREKLEAERAMLVKQVVEIDAMLARMPKAETGSPRAPANAALPVIHPSVPVSSRVAARKKMTNPEIVIDAIAETPGTLSSDIITVVQMAKPKVKARDVFSVIYRLKKRGAVRIEGERGEQRHYLVEGVSAAAE